MLVSAGGSIIGWILPGIVIIVTIVNTAFYMRIANKKEPLWQAWPGSGFYFTWKHRH